MKKIFRLFILVNGCLLLIGISFKRSNSDMPSRPIHWIIGSGAIQNIMKTGDWGDVKNSLVNEDTLIIVGHKSQKRVDYLPVRFVISAPSLDILRSDTLRKWPVPIAGVLYDDESWKFTPLYEQKNIKYSMQQAAEIAHTHNWILVATPAIDLMRKLALGKNPSEAYLSHHVPQDAAEFADIYEIQAQRFEMNTKIYSKFVNQAVRQARSVNPKIVIYAGLSTNPTGHIVTAQTLYQDIKSTRNLVVGCWLNIPSGGAYCPTCGKPKPLIAVNLIKMLQNQD